MRTVALTAAMLAVLFLAPPQASAMSFDEAIRAVDPTGKYLFYLHPAIVESQGADAVSPQHGPYALDRIVTGFEDRGLIVVSETRTETNANRAASDVVLQVRQLMAAGVPPTHITVAGFSKGGFIALLAASSLNNAHVKFAILAGCGRSAMPYQRFLKTKRGARLRGTLFSLYATNDLDAGSCADAAAQSPGDGFTFREQRIRSLKGHGLFYQPRPEWMNPVAVFAKGSL